MQSRSGCLGTAVAASHSYAPIPGDRNVAEVLVRGGRELPTLSVVPIARSMQAIAQASHPGIVDQRQLDWRGHIAGGCSSTATASDAAVLTSSDSSVPQCRDDRVERPRERMPVLVGPDECIRSLRVEVLDAEPHGLPRRCSHPRDG
jgi:hypothetical protein